LESVFIPAIMMYMVLTVYWLVVESY